MIMKVATPRIARIDMRTIDSTYRSVTTSWVRISDTGNPTKAIDVPISKKIKNDFLDAIS